MAKSYKPTKSYLDAIEADKKGLKTPSIDPIDIVSGAGVGTKVVKAISNAAYKAGSAAAKPSAAALRAEAAKRAEWTAKRIKRAEDAIKSGKVYSK